ncbi:MAG: type IV secretion system DNA-binding domain-containing protein [bacterium]|nr:type IV secretion system DNA-binding domain-containing protein [bacterium]
MPKLENNITYFAETNFRNERKRFGIKRRDRARHMYVIGKTGVGKTTLLENMATQDILNGEGVCIVDPHGDFAEKMLKFVPQERVDDVLYFAPHDTDWPIAFNMMENVNPAQKHLVANGLLGVFKKIWGPEVWSARMEYILNNTILALLEYPNSTLLGINRMLSDKHYRDEAVSKITDPAVKSFWLDEFAKYSDRFMTEAGAAIQNKVGQFISNPLIRNIIGQVKSSFDIRDMMDQKKIFIVNLSKGRIGEENSRLIGAMLITKIYLAGMSRVDVPESEREDFYLYVDEFQNFANESFKDILSEARKYRLNLVLAHQYVAQMDEGVRDAVIGNVGTLITFRVGAFDAELLEKEFAPEFDVQDIVGIGFGSIYLKLMIDGMASRPFSANTLPPIESEKESLEDRIIEESRSKYANAKEEVEEKITQWHSQMAEGMRAEKASGSASTRKSLPHTGLADASRPQVFEASCSVCGKKVFVPFEPDGKRAIYCKTHMPGAAATQAPQKHEPFSVESITSKVKEPISSGDKKSVKINNKKDEFAESKMPEKILSLSELNTKKKVNPKLDELRKVLDEAMAGDESEEDNSIPALYDDSFTDEELIDDVTEYSVREEVSESFKKPAMEELKIPDDKEIVAKKPEKKILKLGDKITFD